MGKNVQQRAIVVAAVVIGAILTLLPTMLRDSFTPKWFTKPIALGLDISGGVHLVYGVKAREAVTSRMQALLAGARSDLRSKKIAVAQSQVASDGSLQIVLLSDASLEAAKQVIGEKAPELSFVSLENDGGRPRLRYQISEQTAKKIEVDEHVTSEAFENLKKFRVRTIL